MRKAAIAKRSNEGLLTRNLESSEVAKIVAVDTPSTKYIYDIVDKCCRMSLAGTRDESNALQFSPSARIGIECPSIIVVVLRVCTAESVIEANVSRSLWGR